jgi:hypothetical protein
LCCSGFEAQKLSIALGERRGGRFDI